MFDEITLPTTDQKKLHLLNFTLPKKPLDINKT